MGELDRTYGAVVIGAFVAAVYVYIQFESYDSNGRFPVVAFSV